MEVAVLLERALDTQLPAPDRFAAGTRLRTLLDGLLLSLAAEVAAAGQSVATALQDHSRMSGRSVERELRRAAVVDAVPSLGQALGEGQVSVDHVDALDRAMRRLDPPQRTALLSSSDLLVDLAREETPEQFERLVQSKVGRLLTDADHEARLSKQRRDTRLRTWVDKVTGMWNVRGEFDPVTGQRLQILIDQRHDTLFAAAAPDTAPADPLERALHLRALALVDLIDQPGSGVRPEVVVTLRPVVAAGGGTTEVDWRLPIEVPRSVLEQLVTDPATLITPVVIAGDLVLHAPGQLNLGRATRLANRAQRRALQARYPTCVVDGCTVPFHRCKIHHLVWWRHGGTTDLENLAPVCDHDHDRIHHGLIDLPPPTLRAA
jgi:hypothetical protein